MRGIKTKETFQFTKKPIKTPVELYFASIPNKLVYKTNETLDLSGLEVIVKYDDDTTKNITGDILTEPLNGSTLSIIGNNDITISYTENEVTVSNSFPVVVEVKIVSWSEGTDEEIVAMVEAADRGLIDLTECWAVGNERKITLNAMSSISSNGESTEAQPEQEVTFVLMNKGGKELVNSTPSGRTECSFVVGQKEALVNNGPMSYSSTSSSYWVWSIRRTWCNGTYRNAIPESIRPIFKQHKNYQIHYNNGNNTTNETKDYFAIPYTTEIIEDTIGGKVNPHFEWYNTEANRIISGSYWTRHGAGSEFVYIYDHKNYTDNNGVFYEHYLEIERHKAYYSHGIVVFGVI